MSSNPQWWLSGLIICLIFLKTVEENYDMLLEGVYVKYLKVFSL